MSIRSRMMLAAFLGGWLTQVGSAAEPPRLGLASNTPLPAVSSSPNQQLAETIANHLRQSGQLRGFTVDIVVAGGAVELEGTVSNQPQREEVLRLVQGVPGVVRVRDRLRLVEPLTRVQAIDPGTAVPPGFQQPGFQLPGAGMPNMIFQPGPGIPNTLPPIPPDGVRKPEQIGPPQEVVPPGGVPGVIQPPIVGGAMPPIQTVPQGGVPEPVPLFAAPGLGYHSLNPPRMPPYAWPTYAPYNNYSRVAYPEAYPYNAWPFIGPIHPFPKVPLGWRSVKLQWDDGYWWFSRTATRHDWWRLRFY